ncbi:MAG TPA: ATP synthase F0 subunit B [Patescibacteria group bacterium]|nr:ATP synthase F0 subunit B [Patescibacteria group bacterium]
MEVLGTLGIDFWSLIAQIINFVLLLWILTKFVYKPLMKLVDKEEKEKQKLVDDVKHLEEEKKKTIIERDQTLTEAKKRSEHILEEAERVGEMVRLTIQKETEDAKQVLLNQTSEQLKNEAESARDEEKQKLASRVRQRLKESFVKMANTNSLKDLERGYLEQLTHEIASLPSISGDASHGVLEYGVAPDGADIDRVKSTLHDKTGREISLETKEKPDLISGYRLEFAGYQLNHHLLEDITYAIHHNETP